MVKKVDDTSTTRLKLTGEAFTASWIQLDQMASMVNECYC
jgi:hypothetical protein